MADDGVREESFADVAERSDVFGRGGVRVGEGGRDSGSGIAGEEEAMRPTVGDLISFRFGSRTVVGVVLSINDAQPFAECSVELLERTGKIIRWDIWPREFDVLARVS